MNYDMRSYDIINKDKDSLLNIFSLEWHTFYLVNLDLIFLTKKGKTSHWPTTFSGKKIKKTKTGGDPFSVIS